MNDFSLGVSERHQLHERKFDFFPKDFRTGCSELRRELGAVSCESVKVTSVPSLQHLEKIMQSACTSYIK